MEQEDSWGGYIQINIICILLNITIAMFYEKMVNI